MTTLLWSNIQTPPSERPHEAHLSITSIFIYQAGGRLIFLFPMKLIYVF